MIAEPAVDGLPPAEAAQVWQAWVAAHGEPGTVLYGRLAELAAVEIDDETVRATPLALDALYPDVLDAGVEVPLLPAPDDMTAADLVLVGRDGTDEQLERESAAWFARRDPATAAEQLLQVAATGEHTDRVVATALAVRAGDAAEPAWRAVLDDPAVRPYARRYLAEAGHADVEPTEEDSAWLLTDALADAEDYAEPEELAELAAEAVPPGAEAILERMWRLGHPASGQALGLIGRHHPDTAVAKAARKAAMQSANR
jgi:hypothetical protein